MDEISSPVQSSAPSPVSLSSPWHYLSGLAAVLASIAGIVILSLKGQLNDVSGWAKLVAIGWAGMAASDRANLASVAVRGWFRRGK
jgi:hypothetical protein